MQKLGRMISAIEVILKHVHEGIVIADSEGRVVYVNDANQRITGLDNSRIFGCYVKDVVPESSIPEVIKTGMEKLGVKTRVNDKFVISNIVPIYDGGEIIGAISVFLDVTELENLNMKLKRAEERINHLSKQLSTFLGEGDLIVGRNPLMQKAVNLAQKAASFSSNVLITGESGTGKEILARFIHNNGPRKNKPFIAVNCGAIPETLLESELFGYEPGAFTGAGLRGKPGLFEQADGGTIFLDEIGDMPLSLQVKLLRVLQDREVRRLGSSRKIKLDVRVIAATNKNLEEMVKNRSFREDLYYRLNVIKISLPPLRDRKEDIPVYVRHLVEKLSRRMGKNCPKVTPSAMKLLMRYDYPGNIRELENILEKSLIMDEDDILDHRDLPELIPHPESRRIYPESEKHWPTLSEVEKNLINRALSSFPSKVEAARALGISRATLLQEIERVRHYVSSQTKRA
ncbi:sigma-54 interaction domain-containing protein [Thermosediminibacter litoriperuensis]|uniref:PAS domain S-box-containing protein n=1 Tax=Thermosediminibacter litoriperuensis TaxID=291989 RepID=A0A5S5AWY7_9FIRM|nr:sigma 54-interacting transcriptional regulator [Thermosediminibacter litoriperuensis]TYP56153.1 PAS domain S-box-containing protein [Thermosediminibacter litoriperuensis]